MNPERLHRPLASRPGDPRPPTIVTTKEDKMIVFKQDVLSSTKGERHVPTWDWKDSDVWDVSCHLDHDCHLGNDQDDLDHVPQDPHDKPRGKPGQTGRADSKEWTGLLEALIPMVWVMRMSLMLPITLSVSDRRYHAHFRWLSTPMLLSFVGWVVLVVVGCGVARRQLEPVTSGQNHFHLYDSVPVYASTMFLYYIIALPNVCWRVAGVTIQFTDKFQSVLDQFAALGGPEPFPRFRSTVWLLTTIALVLTAACEIITMMTLPVEPRWWEIPNQLHSFVFPIMGTMFWILNCRAFSFLGHYQAGRISEDFERLGLPGLRAHHRLWLDLAKTLKILSLSWARALVVLLGLFYVTYTSLCFVLLHFIIDSVSDRRLVGITVYFFLVSYGIFVIFNAAYLATTSTRAPIIKRLLQMSVSVRDEQISNEILRFLYNIELESPGVSLCGFAIVNRSSIISLLVLANTHLVVLSQFTMSEPATANFTEITEDFFDENY